MRKRLAIISTHPIQYYAPIFQLLAQKIDLMVFYTAGQQVHSRYDKGFERHIEWDLPLLERYDYTFIKNTAKDPGSHHYWGIINPDLIKNINDFTPDDILVYGWAYHSHLKVLKYYKGKIPLYFRGDSTLLNRTAGLKNVLKSMLLKWVYKKVDVAFFVGTANKAYFKSFGMKEEQLKFAPHAIDNERFNEERTNEAQQLRNKLGIGDKEILILFAGKFESVKNPLLLLKAFAKIRTAHLHLLFVGNGKLESELQVESLAIETLHHEIFELTSVNKLRMGSSVKIHKRIHFMDFQNQTKMPIIYQASDLFCLPSISETWGLAVNEAMASGKGVLVSDQVGCAIDLVKSGENGETFIAGNLDDLVQKLKKLTNNKEKLRQMGMAAQRLIQNWSFDRQVKTIVDTLEKKYAK